MQLVCVDRRYQRMNCFNIRELQGVLKRKFFTDLVNTNDHRDFLNQSMIGLRFKTNNQLSITPDVESFFNLGTTNNTKSKTLNFTNSYESFSNSFKLNFSTSNILSFMDLNIITSTVKSYLVNVTNLILSLNPTSLITLTHIIQLPIKLVTANFTFESFSGFGNTSFVNAEKTQSNVIFSTENSSATTHDSQISSLLSETSNNARFTRFNNPLISYDYKCGHYLGI